jgi:hypothetical protein
MPKSLADGHTKLTQLIEAPADPTAPTDDELNAGEDIQCEILASDYTFTFVDSDKIAEKALCDSGNVNAIGPSNLQAAMTFFRRYVAGTGAVATAEEPGYQATKVKGTTTWVYQRKSGKLETEAWAADDEFLGMELLSDNPQEVTGGGYIKRRIPFEPQGGWEGAVVAGV